MDWWKICRKQFLFFATNACHAQYTGAPGGAAARLAAAGAVAAIRVVGAVHRLHIIFETLSFSHKFVSHHLLDTILNTLTLTHHLSHTALSHTILHKRFCHTLSFTHHQHHLSHKTLPHTPSFTHLYVTHYFSHTTLLYTIFHTPSVTQLDDGWPESEKDVFQAALSMVVVKN